MKTVELGSLRNIQYTMLRKDGSTYPGELSISTITESDGNPKGFLIIIEDITDRKVVQEKLDFQQVKLKKQRDELESFASTVAHDIRGKLQVISMYNTMSQSEHKDKIHDQITEISNFLENLLILAKEGEILGELTDISLTKMLVEITSKINSLAPNMEVIIKNLPNIKGDSLKLKQVFENILINVVKHANATDVNIYSEESDNFHILNIEDNGDGITEKRQQEIRE